MDHYIPKNQQEREAIVRFQTEYLMKYTEATPKEIAEVTRTELIKQGIIKEQTND